MEGRGVGKSVRREEVERLKAVGGDTRDLKVMMDGGPRNVVNLGSPFNHLFRSLHFEVPKKIKRR